MEQYPYRQDNGPAGSIFEDEQGEVPVQQPAAGPSPYRQAGATNTGNTGNTGHTGPAAPAKKRWRNWLQKIAHAPRKKAKRPPRRRQS